MDVRAKSDYDCMETLCVQYWIHLSDLEVDKARAVGQMLDIQHQSAPLQTTPFYLKKRFELHDVLTSVVKASKIDLLDVEFRSDVFGVLNDIFKELKGNMISGDLAHDLKKAEIVFIRYQMLLKCNVDTISSVKALSDDEFGKYYGDLLRLLEICELTNRRWIFVVEEPSDKDEFVKIFDILGEESFPKFNTELHNEFIRIFCHGLKYFHAILGKPKHFRQADVISKEIYTEISESKDIPDSFDCMTPVQDDSPNEEDTPVAVNKATRGKLSLRDFLRSNSPLGKEEVMRPEGLLWEDNSSDRLSFTVGRSSAKRVKWTAAESQSLVEGIKKYGVGQWALIQADRSLNLGSRTNIQLKDRWRNLVKNDPTLRRF